MESNHLNRWFFCTFLPMRNMYNRALVCVLMSVFCYGAASGQSLEKYLWKNRILFLIHPQKENPQLNAQIRSFEGFEDEIQDRQLLVFVMNGNAITDIDGKPANLDPNQMIFASFTGVILIGKDGGIKLQEPFVVEPRRIFDLIDGMPMRRSEMKN